MTKVLELYGKPTSEALGWPEIAAQERCPFLNRKCLKNRKSEPEITIGTCTVAYGREARGIIICPIRLLERSQIFTDCIHLLALHQPGNELRIVPEITVPGGSIDYCLVSVHTAKVVDFVGIELQTLDTTGSVWPERQRFLRSQSIPVREEDAESGKGFGMNWKMTAKTILMQLHHKIQTFEHLSKHLVLVAQDHLIDYMQRQFSFEHLRDPRLGDPMHLHSYQLLRDVSGYRIQLAKRWSTDANGLAQCLGLQTSPKVELERLVRQIEEKLPRSTLLTVGEPLPLARHDRAADED